MIMKDKQISILIKYLTFYIFKHSHSDIFIHISGLLVYAVLYIYTLFFVFTQNSWINGPRCAKTCIRLITENQGFPSNDYVVFNCGDLIKTTRYLHATLHFTYKLKIFLMFNRFFQAISRTP
jgi:hypothetical protein